jgi:amino acid adenylation domain-containing protein
MKEIKKPDKKNLEDILALTPMQEGILFHYLKVPNSDQYVEQLSLEISGEIDDKIFEKAWNVVAAANEMLRTVFRWEKMKHPMQIVLRKNHLTPLYHDLSGLDTAEKNTLVEEIRINDRKKKFDLREIPFRVTLCKIEPARFQMIVTNHHILYDGWSNGIILKEFFNAYNDLVHKRTPHKPVKNKFKEYINWLKSREKSKQEKFWSQYLKGVENPTELAVKMRNAKDQPGEKEKKPGIPHTEKYQARLDQHTKNKIEEFARKHRITLAALFYSSWGILLQKYNNSDDVLFGTTVSGRSAKLEGIEDMVGLFINTLPMRVKQIPAAAVTGMLNQVNHALKAREEYESTSLVDINQYSQSDNRGELFDSLVVLENYPLDRRLMLKDSELSVESYSLVETANYDLVVEIVLFDDIDIDLVYNREYFEPATIERMSDHFCRIMENIIKNPTQPVHEIDILSEEEKQQLLVDFNKTDAEYPHDMTIHQLFAEQAEQTPDYIALVGHTEGTRGLAPLSDPISITYNQLNRKSNQLASLLKEKGVKSDTIVGILLERSIDMIIGILGILKAGGAYLPINPEYPEERINYMLKESDSRVLLAPPGTQVKVKADVKENSRQPQQLPLQLINIDTQPASAFDPPLSTLTSTSTCQVSPANLAYIIYTSGSTGKPKGVMVKHTSAVNVLSALQKEYPLNETDAYLGKTSVVFDVSVTELFGWFFGAGRLIILEKDGEKDPYKILDAMERTAVTHINFVPSMFNAFLEVLDRQKVNRLTTLRYIFLAGEALLPGVVNKFRQLGTEIQLENIYGPTEGTVYSSKYPLSHWHGRGSIPIGKPMQNIRLYILDRDNHLQPIGVPGELCIGGVGVARGYLNQPQLTAESFCLWQPGGRFLKKLPPWTPRKNFSLEGIVIHDAEPHPETMKLNKSFCGVQGQFFQKEPLAAGGKIYQTGDLARWLQDGNIEFLGRSDHQVKIRGFRIETAEIENHLRSFNGIREAVVVAKQDQKVDKYLCAYIVTNGAVDISQLKTRLSAQLPDYMIPPYFMRLDKLPLTPTGKIDRKALPEPEISAGKKYAAPTNEIEKQLVKIWAQVLGRDASHASQLHKSIGINDNFFEIGGHSLKATRLIGRIHQAFDIEVSLAQLSRTPTVRGIYHYIQKADPRIHRPIDFAEEREYYLLSSAQKRLYFLQQMDFNNISYNIPQVFLIETEPDREKMERTFKSLIERHESFRTSFKMIEDEPVQQVHKELEFEIEYYDLKRAQVEVKVEEKWSSVNRKILEGTRGLAPLSKDPVTRSPQPATALISSFIRPFDLSRAPLLRVGLIELLHTPAALRGHPSQEGREHKYIFMVDMHHIISDGTSMAILIKEFTALYADTRTQLPVSLLQYKDYSEWWRKEKDSPSMKQQEAYWLGQYKKEIPVLSLPTDYKRPVTQSFVGNTINFTLDKKTEQQLKTLALKEGTSLFMVLLAVFNVLLTKVSGQEDIVVGIGTEGRRHEDLTQIVGMFVNTLALRNTAYQNTSFKNFLGEIKQRSLEAFENQEYPFEDLVEKLSIKRDRSRNPLFDVMFQFNNLEIPAIVVPGLKLETYQFERQVSKFDLTLWADEGSEELLLAFEFCTKLFRDETIKIFIRYFKEIVLAVTTGPDRKLWEIRQITAANKQEILSRLNQCIEEEVKAISKKGQIFQLRLNECLKTSENKIAIEYGPQTLTYGELDKRSNHIANRMINHGIHKGTSIGVLMDDRGALICAVIGILKAGCVFVPLDPAHPRHRQEVMINAADITLIFTDKLNLDAVNGSQFLQQHGSEVEFCLIDRWFAGIGNSCNHEPSKIHYQAEDRIYIYFTSGTTGTPKAILGKSISLAHFIHWEIDTFGIDDTYRFSQLTTPGFDAFLRDVFVPLCRGGVVCIPGSKDVQLNPELLLKWLEGSRVHLVHCVPSLFRVLSSNRLTRDRLPELKMILFSGEPITATDLESWFEVFDKRIALGNLWGTSETTMAKTFHLIRKSDLRRERIPVGKSIKGAVVMVLDENREICDPLVTGELYIHTPFRSFGYYNDTQSNKRRFIQNPFHDNPGDLLHKTGDIGRILPDGTIDLLGRNDRQVKVRGIRIELEEVESILLRHPPVKEAAVLKKEQSNHNELLCAYIVEKENHEVAGESLVETLKQYLLERLPGYMVPASIMKIGRIPRTPNGKVDYKALHAYKEEKHGYRAPQNHIQERLLQLWIDILKIDHLGIWDNFFTSGGNSLGVMTLISRIHKDFAVRVPLGDIFNNPTIEKLAAIIEGMKVETYASLEPLEKREYYPLSSAQKRLYLLQQMDWESIAYNMSYILLIETEPDRKKIEKTFKNLVERHESFRISFELVGDEPVQRIHDQVEFEIECYDAERMVQSTRHETQSIGRNKEHCASFIRPFDLSHAPLLRVGLIKTEKPGHFLVVDMHHIISDGVSTAILIEEFVALYANTQLPGLRLQYRDYSEWQNKANKGKRIRQQKEYWQEQFAGEIPVLNLPIDYPRPMIQSFAGNTLNFEIGENSTTALKSLALKEKVTLFMLLLSITTILLSKLSSQEEVILGTPIAARRHADLQRIIGMFVNTLALQNTPAGGKTFKQFLHEVKKRTLEAFENQEYPFEELVETVSMHKDVSRNPLFDVIFALQNIGIPEVEIAGLKLKPCEYENKTSKFDLAVNGVEERGILVFKIEYCSRLFKEETISRFIKCFRNVCSSVLQDVEQKISGISIIPDDEKHRILYEFNDTAVEYPLDKTLHHLFARQVEKAPDNIAVVGPQQTKNRTYMTYTTHISYHELNEKSNQLTYLLIEKGVKPDTIVAIMMERSLEMVIGLLGILNAGGAYLSIDPEYPEERITYMLKDSGAEILLKDNHFTPEAFNNRPKGISSHLHLQPTTATSLAYVIYTSGTTARPKGVLVRHHGLVNMIFAYRKVFGENPGFRVSQSASPAFDAMAFEIWPCLSNGAALYILDDESRVDPAEVKQWLIEKQITISFQPTVMAEKLLDEAWPEGSAALKALSTAGDRLTRNPKRPYPFTLYNLYGPTEDTVWTTWTEVKVKPNPEKSPSIGKPLDNHQVYIVSPNMQLQPIGVPGELCIAGDGLAKGYLNQPELTIEKFCLRRPGGALFEKTAPPGPHRKNFLLGDIPGQGIYTSYRSHMSYIYRTGDLALWLGDGSIQFLGRCDHQIKIRGFRIEMSEIEKNLLTHEDVKEAVVAAKERENKDKYLCAYIVSHPGGTLAGGVAMVKELRDHLSRMLPHYMVPTYFVQLQQVPITPNGKVDRKALPEPDIGDTEQENIPPRNLVERKLVEIWSHVLGIGKDKISITANFFEIGGHSLNAEMIKSRIHKELNVKLPLVEIFKTPTIRELAAKIQEAEQSEFSDMEPVEKKEYYDLSYSQKRLWFLHSLDPTNLSYHMPGWLRFSHLVNMEVLQRSLSGLFTRHESFRTGIKKIREQPVQFIRERVEIPLRAIDISGLAEDEKQQKTGEMIKQITAQSFDLENPPLFRSVLIKLGDEAFLFVYNMHHIISDGWSMGIVRREFHRLYNEYAKGNQWDPEPVPYQYKDFAAWHNQQIWDSELRRTALRYWKKVIETGLPVLKLPYYYSGSPEDKSGASYRCTIDQNSTEKLHQLAKDNHTTMSALLFTLYNLLFAYLSGQKEIVTTIISAGRGHSSLDMVVGYFINPVFVKIYVDLRGDFEELLSAINRQVLEALQHQNYPFELLLDDLKIAYPNISASFNFISMQDIDMEIEPDSLASYHIREFQEVKYPLSLFLTEYKNGIEINWEYQKTMFEPAAIENTAEKYLDLIVEVTEIDE